MKFGMLIILLSAVGALYAEQTQVPLDVQTLSWAIKNNLCTINDGTLKIVGQYESGGKNFWQSVVISPASAVKMGQQVKISADIKTVVSPGTKGIFMVCFRLANANGQGICYSGIYISQTQDWKTCSNVFSIPENATKMQIYVVAQNMDANSSGEVKNISWEFVK